MCLSGWRCRRCVQLKNIDLPRVENCSE
jgi:hypothetical protein